MNWTLSTYFVSGNELSSADLGNPENSDMVRTKGMCGHQVGHVRWAIGKRMGRQAALKKTQRREKVPVLSNNL